MLISANKFDSHGNDLTTQTRLIHFSYRRHFAISFRENILIFHFSFQHRQWLKDVEI